VCALESAILVHSECECKCEKQLQEVDWAAYYYKKKRLDHSPDFSVVILSFIHT
jgi:hypothetical protein